ncbi:signal peptidase [Bacillus pakistanensis]|uniref:Signal peptidase I n=1 Tax=Rossellomorea pakistanensis TaxID=992288 RepID=A0ABS2NJY0_9BACI|nr:signal peptidase I [Bacillus pakistanensis]MBM7588113.1 signal peptidase [Bacillus pakistanensis]
MKKTFKIVRTIFSYLLIALFLTLAIIVISSKASGGEPTVFGHQMKVVLSGSMEPTFKTGSIIVIKPSADGSQYKKGDVITFKEKDNKIITHRITEVKKANNQVMYTTKGDNNAGADLNPVLSQNVIGKYADITIPYVGYLLDYANSKLGAALLLIIPGLILFIYSIFSIMGALKEIDPKKKVSAT